MRCF